MEQTHPTTFVIFGATGDLFRRKLAPALFNLFSRGFLPKHFRLVAFSRRPWGNPEFRAFLRETLKEKMPEIHTLTLENFLERVLYIEGDLQKLNGYQKVAELLAELDKEAGVCMNKLFYLATPPFSYEVILNHISASGLAIPCAPAKNPSETGWTRILIEKPFGSDLLMAQKLDTLLSELFSENQIFRIDHYLAKETLRRILQFRFSEGLFEQVWNGEHIEKIEVRIFEKDGLNGRGASYDSLGALRDVGQNHALQMAALSAMERPDTFSAEAIREKRAEILQRFKIADSDISKSAVRGRYEGYENEGGVKPDSSTETYFKLQLKVAAPRWRAAAFTVESGKGLPESKAEISVHFKKPVTISLEDGKRVEVDTVYFKIQPKEEITALYGREEVYKFSSQNGGMPEKAAKLDAYEKVLLDAVLGDQTLFASTAEVVAEWNIVTPIIEGWQNAPLVKYPKGTVPEV